MEVRRESETKINMKQFAKKVISEDEWHKLKENKYNQVKRTRQKNGKGEERRNKEKIKQKKNEIKDL